MPSPSPQYLVPEPVTDGDRGKGVNEGPHGTSLWDIRIFCPDVCSRARNLFTATHSSHPLARSKDGRPRLLPWLWGGLRGCTHFGSGSWCQFFNALFDPALPDRLFRKWGWGRKTSVLVNVIILQGIMHSLIANKLSEYRSSCLPQKSSIPVRFASAWLVFKITEHRPCFRT